MLFPFSTQPQDQQMGWLQHHSAQQRLRCTPEVAKRGAGCPASSASPQGWRNRMWMQVRAADHSPARGHELCTVVPCTSLCWLPTYQGVQEGKGTFGEDFFVPEATPGEVLREHSTGSCPDRKLLVQAEASVFRRVGRRISFRRL